MLRVEKQGCIPSRFRNQPSGFASCFMSGATRVGVMGFHERRHDFDNRRIDPCGCVIVEINRHSSESLLFEPM